LSYLANTQTHRQTDKQTKSGKNITSLAEVKNYKFWAKFNVRRSAGRWNFPRSNVKWHIRNCISEHSTL